MSLPSFYIADYRPEQQELVLDEDNSRHIVQVLRMKPGETLQLTDGKGALLTTSLLDDHKKKCRVAVRSVVTLPPSEKRVSIAISPLKNASRFEWFLEKATEIGVGVIIPLLCERTERPSIRQDRLHQIAVSAMLQSQQRWLPELRTATTLTELILTATDQKRYIAHCLEAPRPTSDLAALVRPSSPSSLILIGPEGDFTAKEVDGALGHGFLPVSLGPNRLRTETAGVTAAVMLCIG
ncbi:MAG TPA: RsmE family RNA methyltransferase [Puia sp.]|jgi:16S rRNA (uracil1498-N3)-methyltransferase|nr:RsmE family RNA methyltransferase [Puia sp.]